MNLYSASVLCFSFGSLLAAIFSIFKRRDAIAYRFLLFTLSVAGWGALFSFWINQVNSAADSLKWIRLFYVFLVFIPSTWIHFILEFLDKKESFKGFYFLNYFVSFGLSIISLSGYLVRSTHDVLDLRFIPVPNFFHHLHIIHFFLISPLGIYYLVKAYFDASGYRREQLRFFVVGLFIGFSAGAIIYLPYYGIKFPLWPELFLPFYPLFTGIAMIRYGLFDASQIADAFQREKMAVLGTMAASLNHELRNPLFIAKGRIESHLDAVKEGVYSNDLDRMNQADKTLAMTQTQLERAVDIIKRFSDFAKPFAGKNDREDVDLNEVMKDVFELVSNEFESNRIDLKYERGNGIQIKANRRQLEEILLNIVMNACYALQGQSADDAKSICITATQNASHVIVEIADNGPGIAPDNLKKIFEPFFTTKGEKGTGLGLYITKQLVERNGGKISVISKIGKGTTFRLEFKKSKVEAGR